MQPADFAAQQRRPLPRAVQRPATPSLWLRMACAATALLLAAGSTGCGSDHPEPPQDPLADYRPRVAALLNRIAEIGAALPASGSVTRSRCTARPEPAPVSTVSWSNTVFMMPGQLSEPLSRPADSVLDLSYYRPYFRAALRDLRASPDRGPVTEYALPAMRARLDSTLAVTWLVVTRPVRVVMPIPVSQSEMIPGSFDAEVFVADLRNGAVTCSFRARGRVTEMFVFAVGEPLGDSLAVVRRGMKQSVNQALMDSLRAVAGANVTVK